jgi:uncharacterized Tic20 family protein
MKKIQRIIVGALVAIGFGTLTLVPAVGAVDVTSDACAIDSSSVICKSNKDSAKSIVGSVVNTLLYILGAISVVMIIIGGFMYTTSGGDAGAVTKAKNTILYAVVGLVVAFAAYAIVNWVLGAFKQVNTTAAGTTLVVRTSI